MAGGPARLQARVPFAGGRPKPGACAGARAGGTDLAGLGRSPCGRSGALLPRRALSGAEGGARYGRYSTLVCIHSEDSGEQETLLRRARSLARFDTFWKTGSVVVERFIPGSDGGTPAAFTVDACVQQDGTVSVECLGRMLIQDRKRYDGAVIGKGAVDPQLAVQLRDVAAIFGRALAQRGFTGLFDLDLVVDGDGHAWVCEMNVRRASPSHLQSIAHRAFGSSWATRGAVFGRDYVYVQGSLKLSYKDIKVMAAEFRSRSPALLGLLITQAVGPSCGAHPFGYAIVADDALTCAQEADRFERFVYAF